MTWEPPLQKDIRTLPKYTVPKVLERLHNLWRPADHGPSAKNVCDTANRSFFIPSPQAIELLGFHCPYRQQAWQMLFF